MRILIAEDEVELARGLKFFQLCGWNMRRGGILRDEKTA